MGQLLIGALFIVVFFILADTIIKAFKKIVIQTIAQESLLTIPKGTLIKVDGIPFVLVEDTLVKGNKANLNLTNVGEKERNE